MAKPKVQARSSRIAISNPSVLGFGANPGSSDPGRPPSTLSYFADLPDISSISNPNVVVFFKNLFKKDSTTTFGFEIEEMSGSSAKYERVDGGRPGLLLPGLAPKPNTEGLLMAIRLLRACTFGFAILP